ncbi:SGNH/GDSL hydrolase family protein [Paracoccaceae bacterium GXU_MW_L88]
MKAALMTLALMGMIGAAYLYGVIGRTPTPPGAIITQSAGAAIPATRPAHILILGTSLTSRGNWTATLETELNRCRATGLRVETLAKPGASVRWGITALRGRLRQGTLPDLIIAEFSGNDASPWNGMPLFLSRSRHEQLVRQAEMAGIPMMLATMSPAFGQNAWERPGQNRYHALYRDIAARRDIGLIDTVESWRALAPAERRALMPDGLHPSRAGMAKITVPAFAAALAPLLCDRKYARGPDPQP